MTTIDAGGEVWPSDDRTPRLGQPLYVGHITVDDAIAMHLVDCDRCRKAYESGRPKRLGNKTDLCNEYLHLQMLRADYEGQVNNIVAHTEFGDEAPVMGQLE